METYIDIQAMNDVHAKLRARFSKTEFYQADEKKHDSERLNNALDRALKVASSCESLKKYGFDAQIKSIYDGVVEFNSRLRKATERIGSVAYAFEDHEYALVKKLEVEKPVSSQSEYKPIGSFTGTRNGLIFALLGINDGPVMFYTGEKGQYGIDACFVDVATSKKARDQYGDIIYEDASFKFLCFTAKVGTGQGEDGTASYGVDVGVNLASAGKGIKKDGLMSGDVVIGKGTGFTAMHVVNPDGTTDTSLAMPIIPVSANVHDIDINEIAQNMVIMSMPKGSVRR